MAELTPEVELFCNLTWEPLTSGRAYKTACGHIFSESAAFKSFQKSLKCPVCNSHLDDRNGDIVEVDLDRDERSDGIMFSYILSHTNAVLRAITDASHFRETQRKLQTEYREQKLKENVESETNRRIRRENELANARNEAQTLKKELALKDAEVRELKSRWNKTEQERRHLEKFYVAYKQKLPEYGRSGETAGSAMVPKFHDTALTDRTNRSEAPIARNLDFNDERARRYSFGNENKSSTYHCSSRHSNQEGSGFSSSITCSPRTLLSRPPSREKSPSLSTSSQPPPTNFGGQRRGLVLGGLTSNPAQSRSMKQRPATPSISRISSPVVSSRGNVNGMFNST